MGLFEQYPWLLIPIIVLTVEIWGLLKAVVRDVVLRRHRQERI
ncbi:MAG TPA: hypothetical protein VF937_12170 [Chloroflexota bacterium]